MPNSIPHQTDLDMEALTNALNALDGLTKVKQKPKKPATGLYQLQKIGTDAELFLTAKGKPVPVCGLIGGTKTEPKPVLSELGEGYAVQEDNVMLEFNVPPASSAKEFSNSIQIMLSYLKSEMGARGLDLNHKSSMIFSPEQLTSGQARTFGCEPDFCVWTRTVNEINKADPVLQTLRTAAAHIHVSYTLDGAAPELEDQELLVKVLDMFVGAPSVLQWPDTTTRRAFYGRAGAFRPKSYGIEWRVLGNEWLESQETIEKTFNLVKGAMHWVNLVGLSAALNFVESARQLILSALNFGDSVSAVRVRGLRDRQLSAYKIAA